MLVVTAGAPPRSAAETAMSVAPVTIEMSAA